jgi:hypothetical protein
VNPVSAKVLGILILFIRMDEGDSVPEVAEPRNDSAMDSAPDVG